MVGSIAILLALTMLVVLIIITKSSKMSSPISLTISVLKSPYLSLKTTIYSAAIPTKIHSLLSKTSPIHPHLRTLDLVLTRTISLGLSLAILNQSPPSAKPLKPLLLTKYSRPHLSPKAKDTVSLNHSKTNHHITQSSPLWRRRTL